MPLEVVVAPATARDVAAVAAMHETELADSFLSSLGGGFLRILYTRILEDPGSTLLAASSAGVVVGFVAGTESTRALYRQFARYDGLRAGLVAAPRLLGQLRSVIETLRYDPGPASHVPLPAAELLSLAVDPAARRKGVGAGLVAALQDNFRQRGVDRARVTVASDNAGAIAAYERAGFHRAARIEVHRGRLSEVLVWG